jgi:hypothetical protein
MGERQSWSEAPHEQLVQAFRNLIRQEDQRCNQETVGKATSYPALIISDELGHQEAAHMLGTEWDNQRSLFYMPINRAWYPRFKGLWQRMENFFVTTVVSKAYET